MCETSELTHEVVATHGDFLKRKHAWHADATCPNGRQRFSHWSAFRGRRRSRYRCLGRESCAETAGAQIRLAPDP
eukprot:363007-Chlamydomonas_euryale.AAC.2